MTSVVWNWSPSGPLIQARGCATSGTRAPRLVGPVPSRRRPPRAIRPDGSGAGPCSLSTTARIVSTPPYRLRRLSPHKVTESSNWFEAGLKAAVHGAHAGTTVGSLPALDVLLIHYQLDNLAISQLYVNHSRSPHYIPMPDACQLCCRHNMETMKV